MIALAFLLAVSAPQTIDRDPYGVPAIHAATQADAFFQAGYAVAQDRLWQMETSRRLARGRMAEAFGSTYAASDREVLQTSYTDEELQTQLDRLSPEMKVAYREYTRGVNAWIDEAKRSGLPEGYAKAGLAPEPWTELDSVAITVRLLQQFGRGGAGEIRNMALLGYLQTQPKAKDRVLDILDDFAWFNDPSSVPTVPKADDPIKQPPHFYLPDRKTTERHVASLPKVGLLELLQGVRLASRETSTRVAELVSAPFKTGSYCVVVSPSKSATGRPLLISGPQMGFRAPSIAHEISIDAPGLQVVGMDVPGIPGVLIGHTKNLAWGLTSGIADTDDIFFYPSDGPAGYLFGGQHRELTSIKRTLRVKGGPEQTVTQTRTEDGPVILNSAAGKAIFAKRTSYWMRELESMEAVRGVWGARGADEAEQAIGHATMSFNFFYAAQGPGAGTVGYRYAGLVPLRAEGADPRFPAPGGPQHAWRGFVPLDQMPHARNPRQGVLANWNNKPVSWWPNLDTPAWGRIFHNTTLLNTLDKPSLTVQDLELAAWTIARTDETWPYFAPWIRQTLAGVDDSVAEPIRGFDGRLMDGSRQAATYLRFIDALRTELFAGVTGNFLSPEYFRQVGQPSVMLRALEGKTRVNYLAGRSANQVVLAALKRASETAQGPNGYLRYAAPGIPVPGQPPVPYSNRGTFIQVVESLAGGMTGRSVLPPGVSESGSHALDQVDLARAWLFKPMVEPWTRKNP